MWGVCIDMPILEVASPSQTFVCGRKALRSVRSLSTNMRGPIGGWRCTIPTSRLVGVASCVASNRSKRLRLATLGLPENFSKRSASGGSRFIVDSLVVGYDGGWNVWDEECSVGQKKKTLVR